MFFTTELQEEEGVALAQFLKRVGFSEFRSLSSSDEEAYLMQSAAVQLAKALAENGYSPR